MTNSDGRRHNRGAPGRRWARPAVRVTSSIPLEWAAEPAWLAHSQADATRIAIDRALHPFEGAPIAIKLLTALPCGCRANVGQCGKPAFDAQAYAWRHPSYPGHWVIVPMCPECAAQE